MLGVRFCTTWFVRAATFTRSTALRSLPAPVPGV